ncbi:MAG TPA: potassium-transporting ATPase subunit KdpC, partial [Tepidisphaeraceae bacterium]|nr:potassium-transporting ATPase subunit KdpC [Tepidisphaeraceae bacterium]
PPQPSPGVPGEGKEEANATVKDLVAPYPMSQHGNLKEDFMMLKQLRPTVVCFILLTLLTGVVYPLIVTGVAKSTFPRQAAGSLLPDGGGSALIGQQFDDPRFFWGRLSATTDVDSKPLPYNAANSSGSNLGPTNSALTDAAKARIDALRAADPANVRRVPVDLVTASGSGLDANISPAAAAYQAARVAAARNMDVGKIRALIARHTKGRQLGVLGEPRVNVLELNRALEGLSP